MIGHFRVDRECIHSRRYKLLGSDLWEEEADKEFPTRSDKDFPISTIYVGRGEFTEEDEITIGIRPRGDTSF